VVTVEGGRGPRRRSAASDGRTSAIAIMGALPQAAAQLIGQLVHAPASGEATPTRRSISIALSRRLAAADRLVGAGSPRRSGLPTLCTGLNEDIGFLEDQRDLCAADRAHLFGRSARAAPDSPSAPGPPVDRRAGETRFSPFGRSGPGRSTILKMDSRGSRSCRRPPLADDAERRSWRQCRS